MNIKELEKILDIQNDLDSLSMNLGDLCCELDTENLAPLESVALWSVRQQLGLVVKSFDEFRKGLNIKYQSVWVEEYPLMDKEAENE